MHWQEPADHGEHRASRNIVDMAFRIECQRLPLDHAYQLLQSIAGFLPWFPSDRETGIHTIHGAETGNGWCRPDEGDDQYILLSKRVRLVLRVPQRRAEQCGELCGKTLTVSSHRPSRARGRVRRTNARRSPRPAHRCTQAAVRPPAPDQNTRRRSVRAEPAAGGYIHPRFGPHTRDGPGRRAQTGLRLVRSAQIDRRGQMTSIEPLKHVTSCEVEHGD